MIYSHETANSYVRRAVRQGALVRPDTCSSCGERGRIQAHHADYSKPLNVVWLCQVCHKHTHAHLVGDAEWVTLRVAATLLGVHQSTVRRWANRGTVETYRTPGGHRRFSLVHMRALIADLP